jgi:hypothetical protein
MNENIRPVVSCDEAESLAVIEPFHCSLSHFFNPPFYYLKVLLKKKPQSQKSLWPLERKNFQLLNLNIAHPQPIGKEDGKYFLVIEWELAYN